MSRRPTTIEDLRASQDAKDCIRNAWQLVLSEPWPFSAEVEFAEGRRWRFDWASHAAMVAIEIDGVVHERPGQCRRVGRHQQASGFEGDCEKLNAAVLLGWMVLRFTPQMVALAPVQCVEQVVVLLGMDNASGGPNRPKSARNCISYPEISCATPKNSRRRRKP